MRAHLKERLLILNLFFLHSTPITVGLVTDSLAPTIRQGSSTSFLLPCYSPCLSLTSHSMSFLTLLTEMCLILLHCLKKKSTKPSLASILLSCLFNSCHEQSFQILPHWPHSLLSPVWLLPWNFILPDTVKPTSYLNPDVLIPPLQSLNFHLCHASLYIQPSFAICVLIWHSTHLLPFLFHFQQRIQTLHLLLMTFLFQFPYHLKIATHTNFLSRIILSAVY